MNSLDFLRPLSIDQKIRLGPQMDGGYIVYNRILKDTTVLLTYGVGWDVRFEIHFNEITGKKVLMFDPTMFGKYIMDFKRLKKLVLKGEFKDSCEYLHFVWEVWKEKNRLLKQNIHFVNEGVAFKKAAKYDTFKNHLIRYNLFDEQILLKMDIEGCEYEIFEDVDIYHYLTNVNQIIIEFHDLRNLFSRFQDIIKNLRVDYEIIHVHGNNWGGEFYFNDPVKGETVIPNVLEVTFVKKEKIILKDRVNEKMAYPTEGLDYPNRPDYSDLLLGFI